ncbi:unnamed protein product [Calypogeia fissa]
MGQGKSVGLPRSRHSGDKKAEEKEKKYVPAALATHVGRKQRKQKRPEAAARLPVVTPVLKCKLRLLKLERVKDYLFADGGGDQLEPGCAILMHNKVLSVVGLLQDQVNPMVSVVKVKKAPLESYADIGGLDPQIQEIKEEVELSIKAIRF